MNAHVIGAIFKRNFVSYFSNPTGYVFICVFVILNSVAAFWPNDFFNANLANLDQLNKSLPYIMLAFIPAITMSIWADERRQGTDELLLTIPATDFDVVLGKYLAAVAIFTVSLVFSYFSNIAVLVRLAWPDSPDFGLLLGNYLGYWIVGLAMLAIGMVASFLTGNLTVGFLLGVMFNAPWVFAPLLADSIKNDSLSGIVRRYGISEQFRDFSRGVVTFSSIAYFLAIVAVMLYLSIVLIGRRHWRGGPEGQSMATHYAIRFVSLLFAVGGVTMFLDHHDRMRLDVTSEQLSSLSPKTRQVLKDLDNKIPVQISAYISKDVPENFVQTKLNLISALREIQATAGDKVVVELHDQMDRFDDKALRAEEQFGIKPVMIPSRERGARKQEEVFMGVAFTCGLDKVVVPFLGRGIPVEYELVRSIATVSQQKRRRIGVLTTDAKLYGGFDMQSMSSTPNQQIVEELQKQYEVVQVDPTNPITEKYDVLLAVQPSSLGQQQMTNFINAVRGGQATAIFEDPFPVFASDVPGTSAPKRPPGGQNPFMMGRQPPPQPKGDITPLWRMLGVDFGGTEVVWQNFNPMPKVASLMPREFVFIGEGSGASEPFNERDSISSKLQQVLFPFPGFIKETKSNNSMLKFSALASTGKQTGTVDYDKVVETTMMGQPRLNPDLPNVEKATGAKYIMAAHIEGKIKNDPAPSVSNIPMSDKSPADDEAASEKEDAGDKKAEAKPAANAADKSKATPKEAGKAKSAGDTEINVVIVADIDCLYSAFFDLRAQGEDPDADVNWDFDNVTFVLNALDVLAKDDRFVDIRKRRPKHRGLTAVTQLVEKAEGDISAEREKKGKELKDAQAAEQRKFDEKISQLQKRKGLNQQTALQELMIAKTEGQRRLDATIEKLKKKRDEDIKRIEREVGLKVRGSQDWYKVWAAVLPPIPPLLVAGFVFFNRRAREREGVSKDRLRG